MKEAWAGRQLLLSLRVRADLRCFLSVFTLKCSTSSKSIDEIKLTNSQNQIILSQILNCINNSRCTIFSFLGNKKKGGNVVMESLILIQT